LRQSGYLAAAGIYALQNNINRLEDDHRRAKELGAKLQQLPWVSKVEPVETNIIIFSVQSHIADKEVIDKLAQKGIAISLMAKGTLRMVTHLDYKEVMHTYVFGSFGENGVFNYLNKPSIPGIFGMPSLAAMANSFSLMVVARSMALFITSTR